MNARKTEFINFCIANGALRFGEFKLNSGRVSPYFFNAGRFNHGASLAQLAGYYAELLIAQVGREFMLYGPAYKGIPLGVATAMQLAARHNLHINFAFNRKEIKDHGEGGGLVGAPLQGDVVIVDDVITAGVSIGESAAIIRQAGAQPTAVAIALDREEIAGDGGLSAAQFVQAEYNIAVHSIITLRDLIAYFQTGAHANAEFAATLCAYRQRYGAQIVKQPAAY